LFWLITCYLGAVKGQVNFLHNLTLISDFTFNYQHGFRSNPIEENSKNDDADRFGTQGWKFRRKVDQDDFDTDSFETTTEDTETGQSSETTEPGFETTSMIVTTPFDVDNEEEVIRKLIEDNENQEKQLAVSLEEVINNLSEIVDNVTIQSIDSSTSTFFTETADNEGPKPTTTTTETTRNSDLDTETNTPMQVDQLDDLSEQPQDEVNEPIVKDFIAHQALAQLQASNLTEKDMSILTALLELETLRGEQKDTRAEIENKLLELELLLNANSSSISDVQEQIREAIKFSENNEEDRVPRKGKTISGFEEVSRKKAKTVNLFENIQKQLFSLLDERHKILQIVSQKINTELAVIQQTVAFLQQLLNLKLDQGLMLFGESNPLLNILKSGSTSVFLMLSKFFQAVESLLGMRDQFFSTFSFDSKGLHETNILERIQKLNINNILPVKIRFLMNVHANSDELGRMVEKMFFCITQIVEAKVEVIESVGKFFENKVDFLSGLSGPSTNPQAIVEAVQTGNLFELLNFGPISQNGVPGISDQELDHTIQGLLKDVDPQVPVLGSAKPLLVDHRILGVLSGSDRTRFVNRYLARRLSYLLESSHSVLNIERGQTVLQTHLQPLHFGTPCTNDINLGRSQVAAVVSRSSRLSGTTGVTVYSHKPVSLDLFGQARLYTNVYISGYVNAKFGHEMFGKCFSKFSGSSPISMSGSAAVDAHVKVVVRNVRIETRVTKRDLVTQHVVRGHVGEQHPHLVFNFNVKIDGTVKKFDINKLKLSGCELQLLGFKMFSHCDLLESLIRRQMDKMLRDTFPLHDRELLYKLENMIKARLGSEVAIPLVLTDLLNSSEGVETVVRKTGELIDLNIKFFNRLTLFTADLETFENLDEKDLNGAVNGRKNY